MSTAMQALAALPESDDLPLRIDTIEGESDVLELLDRIVELSIADNKLADSAKERAKRIEARAERARSLALRILEALEVPTLERPLYTATISHPRKAQVTNSDEVPPEYLRHSVDMRLLAKALLAGEDVAGACLGNPEPRLTVRTV